MTVEYPRSKATKLRSGGVWLLGIGVLTSASLCVWALYGLRIFAPAEAAVPVQVVEVRRDQISIKVNESGTVELGQQQTVRSPVEGAVDEVLVFAGDQVTAGQTLITLRSPERETALIEQALQIDRQQLVLSRSQQEIEEARTQLQADRTELSRFQNLVEEGVVPLDDLEEIEERVRNGEASVRNAEQAAQIAATELEQLRVERERLQRQIEDTVILSPIDGRILSVAVNDGDGVRYGEELIILGDPRQELVRLRLSTLNATKVEVGQPAQISVIGPDPTIYSGEVVSRSPMAMVLEEEGTAVPVVSTFVRLAQPTQVLIPGSQVNVEIVTDQRQNVTVLPIEAIENLDAEPFVWIIDEEGRSQKQPITIGLEDLLEVEITSGVVPGDQVILPVADLELTPGLSVTPDAKPAGE